MALQAKAQIFEKVHRLVFDAFSRNNQQFCLAMASFGKNTAVGDIAKKIGRSSNYISQYRLRLLHQKYIAPAGHGHVRFVLPFAVEFLQSLEIENES